MTHRFRRIGLALLSIGAGWGLGLLHYALRETLSGPGGVTDLAAMGFWTAIYIGLGGSLVLVPIAAFCDHRGRWLGPTWLPTVGLVAGLLVFLALVGWWTGFWRKPGFIGHAMTVGFGAGLTYSLLAFEGAGRERARRTSAIVPNVACLIGIAAITAAGPLVRERARTLETRIYPFRWTADAAELVIRSSPWNEGSLLSADERALLEASGLTGTLSATFSREPLQSHPSQVILLLRELPASRIDLPTPRRGTLVVWQTSAGALEFHPADLPRVDPPRWYLKPNEQGNAMACRGGSCVLIMSFD